MAGRERIIRHIGDLWNDRTALVRRVQAAIKSARLRIKRCVVGLSDRLVHFSLSSGQRSGRDGGSLRTQSAYRWQTDTFIQGLEAQAYRRRLGILARHRLLVVRQFSAHTA